MSSKPEQMNLRALLVPGELLTAQESLPPPPPQPAAELDSLREFQREALDLDRLDTTIAPKTRSQMNRLLESFGLQGGPHGAKVIATPGAAATAGLPSHLASVIPLLVSIKSRMIQDLETNLARHLLGLNPSRREAVAQYLDRLAGHPPAPGTVAGSLDAAGGLRRWIEGPRSPAQNSALQTYFEELSLIALGKAILLKAWSDRGLRSWSLGDLKDVNAALHNTLRSHIPLDRECWQITHQRNIHSWYKASSLMHEIWGAFESWRVTDEGPSFLTSLLAPLRNAHPERGEPLGYDLRFFKALWDSMPLYGLNPTHDSGPLKRPRVAFSPTLRDGAMVRVGPVSVSWTGLEASAFQLMLAELVQLWWGPACPPLWAIGTGLEVHGRDQLALALGSPKPSLLTKITEMEACDCAFVLEERLVRAQGRGTDAQRFREQVDALPYFKKLKTSGTSLGDLQACVALSKLRPGGLLWWAREEPLSNDDGKEALTFLLERAKIVCEWDFSELGHQLPVAMPLFPRHLYLLSREPNVEARLTHRPLRLALSGLIRSHVELPLVLEDALQSQHRPASSQQSRGQWQIHVRQSPTPQREWLEHWPVPTEQGEARMLEHLRTVSLPLANVTTVRETPEGDAARNHAWSVDVSLRGLWISAETGEQGRRLVARQLPRAGKEAQGSGFLVLVPDDGWIAPLSAYLESESVRRWFEHHAERRGDRWLLNDQVVKWIPVPKSLLQALGAASSEADLSEAPSCTFALPLPGEWERLAAEVAYHPRKVSEALTKLAASGESAEIQSEIRGAVFVRAARALEHLRSGQNKLFSMITEDGRIRWRQLLDVLPNTECVGVPFHPKVRMTGNLPPHFPIGRVEKVKSPTAGILLTTEIGFTLHLGSESALILEMIWDQLEGLSHPTWSELVKYLRLPRRLELAEATASDVLHSHGEQSARVHELADLLSACPLF